MASRDNEKLLKDLVESLELPDSAYETAVRRYEDIGQWLSRTGSTCAQHDPHIFTQGSFRLGTAIKPLNASEEYDLDLSCKLRSGITASTHSQEQLKHIIGNELDKYRSARNIQDPLTEKNRCWRLEYKDTLSFHMDIVPCIPESSTIRQQLFDSVRSYGMDTALASSVTEEATGITDINHPSYKQITNNWNISNTEGYAKWFESRMKPMTNGLFAALDEAQVDSVPTYRKKTPLQQVIQLLKRHRDTMFKSNQDSKPISVIITTIVANSYTGNRLLEGALREALIGLKSFADSGLSTLSNPVNPAENFADKWSDSAYSKLQLKENFSRWVTQALRDFDVITTATEARMICDSVNQQFSVNTSEESVRKALNLGSSTSIGLATAKTIETPQAKPWLK